jgi:hypothetical protein
MTKHYAKIFMPGAFVAENAIISIESRNDIHSITKKVLEECKTAYAFFIFSKTEMENRGTEISRGTRDPLAHRRVYGSALVCAHGLSGERIVRFGQPSETDFYDCENLCNRSVVI